MSDDDRPADDGQGDTIDAVGLVSEALEYADRARGHLYAFHQLTGRSDLLLGEAVDALRACGHEEIADRLEKDLVGRNVIADRWTFQIVEDYDDNYWGPFRAFETEVRERLTGGERHLHEARMKQQRRTHGHPRHRPGPRLED
jgi:hypothetical protein